MSKADAVESEAPESKPVVAKSGSGKGQDNTKSVKRNNRNTLGRIMPGDDSASEDEDDGEGNTTVTSF